MRPINKSMGGGRGGVSVDDAPFFCCLGLVYFDFWLVLVWFVLFRFALFWFGLARFGFVLLVAYFRFVYCEPLVVFFASCARTDGLEHLKPDLFRRTKPTSPLGPTGCLGVDDRFRVCQLVDLSVGTTDFVHVNWLELSVGTTQVTN